MLLNKLVVLEIDNESGPFIIPTDADNYVLLDRRKDLDYMVESAPLFKQILTIPQFAFNVESGYSSSKEWDKQVAPEHIKGERRSVLDSNRVLARILPGKYKQKLCWAKSDPFPTPRIINQEELTKQQYLRLMGEYNVLLDDYAKERIRLEASIKNSLVDDNESNIFAMCRKYFLELEPPTILDVAKHVSLV